MRRLLQGLALLAALYAAWYVLRPAEHAPIKRMEVAQIEAGAVTRVTFAAPLPAHLALAERGSTGPDGAAPLQRTTLARTAGSWRLTSNRVGGAAMNAPAEPVRAARVVDAVVSFVPGTFVTDKPAGYAALGLDPAHAVRVQASTVDGVFFDVWVGTRSQSGGTYVRAEGAADVFDAPSKLSEMVRRGPLTYRQYDLVEDPPRGWRRLQVEPVGGVGFSVLHGSDGWLLERASVPIDPDFRLDHERLDRLLHRLTHMRARAFLPQTTTPADVGLDSPQATVHATTNDGAAWHVTLSRQGRKAYAQVNGEPQVYQVDRWIAAQLGQDLFAYQAKSPIDVEARAVVRVHLFGPALDVVLAREAKPDAPWRLVRAMPDVPGEKTPIQNEDDQNQEGQDPKAAQAIDSAAVERLLIALTGMRADRFATPSERRRARRTPPVGATLTDAGGITHTLRFTAALPRRGGRPGRSKWVLLQGDAEPRAMVARVTHRNRLLRGLSLVRPPAKTGDVAMPALVPPGLSNKLQQALSDL